MFKIVTALLMLLVASLNALSFSADEAVLLHSNGEAVAISAQLSSNPIVSDIVFDSHHDQKDHSGECTHHQGASHQCHFGHCQFTLFSTSKLVVPAPSAQRIFVFSEMKISDFVSSLLRPPRA